MGQQAGQGLPRQPSIGIQQQDRARANLSQSMIDRAGKAKGFRCPGYTDARVLGAIGQKPLCLGQLRSVVDQYEPRTAQSVKIVQNRL